MKQISRLLLLAIVPFAFLATESLAQNTNAIVAAVNKIVSNPAVNPVPRDPKWVARHEDFVKRAQQGGVDILFLGDSITDFWRGRGLNIWKP